MVHDKVGRTNRRPCGPSYSGRLFGPSVFRRATMDRLGLTPDRQPEFVDAMNRLSVSWPSPDPEQIEREAELVVEAIRNAEHEA